MSAPRGRGARRGGGHVGAQPARIANMGSSKSNVPRGRGSPSTNPSNRASSQTYKPPHHATAQRGASTRGREPRAAPKRTSASTQTWRRTENAGNGDYKKRIEEYFKQLRVDRENERSEAIRNGLLADPNKRTRLEDAITVVGTCQDMCPEFERIQRIREQAVERPEKGTLASGEKVPSEELMVKCFHRSDAGKDEQLPSDLRPPKILQKTLNYLFDELLGGLEPLASVHKFLWDRTRAIRNDFSIQQVSRIEDLKIAIDCFERIARFHLLSLHQLTHPRRDNGGFVPQQEREQLSNTLVSLMYYYDDCRPKFESPNEAEFRAYSIILEIRAKSHDLQARVQSLPQRIVADSRVQTAMRLQAASGKIRNVQNMLSPLTRTSTVGGGDYTNFWTIVHSGSTTYLMACASEVAFNFIRARTLETMERSYRAGGQFRPKFDDFTLDDLMESLGFDDDEQTQKFLEDVGLEFKERDDGDLHLDLDHVGQIPTDTISRHEQIFSETLVEFKRKHRAFKAIANGLSVRQSKLQGLIGNDSDKESEESLFVSSASNSPERDASPAPGQVAKDVKSLATSNPFAKPATTNPFAAPNTKPSQSFLAPPTAPTSFGGSKESSPLPSIGFGSSATKPLSSFQTPSMSNEQIAQTVFPGSISNSFTAPQSQAATGPAKPDLTSIFNSVPKDSPFASSSNSQGSLGGFNAVPKFGQLFAPSGSASAPSPQAGKSLFDRIEKPEESSKNSANDKPDIAQETKQSSFALFTTQPQASASNVPSSRGSEAPMLNQQPPQFQRPTFQLPSSAADTQQPSSLFATGASIAASASPFPQSGFNFAAASATQQASSSSADEASKSRISPLTKIDSGSEKTDLASKFKQPDDSQTSKFASAFASAAFKSQPKPTTQQQSADSEPFKNPFQNLISEVWKQDGKLGESQLSKNNGGVSSLPAKTTFTEDNKSHTPQSTLFGSASKSLLPQPSLPSSSSASNASTMFSHHQANSSQKSPERPFLTNTQTVLMDNEAQVRSATLEKLAQELLCEDWGFLEQFTENLMEEIFEDSDRIVTREREQEKYARLRSRYLSTKYLALWRQKTWKLNLKRRAIHRRKSLRKSLRDLTQQAEEFRGSSIASDSTGSSIQINGSIPLGSLLSAPHHHHDRIVAESSKTKKRKSLQDDDSLEYDCATNGDTPTQKPFVFKKPKTSHHRRTQTMGLSLPSFPITRESAGAERLRASLGETRRQFGGADSLLSESMLKRARQVIGKTDTTRTDYFRLKARGINPNTPLVPETRKRSRALTESTTNTPTPDSGSAAKAIKLSPPTLASLSAQTREFLSRSQSTNISTKAPPTPTSAVPKFSSDEESLLAQARKLRETLAEGETWFRREREAIEAKTKPKDTPPKGETEKQRKLREWQATPSKTSIRLEKTKAGGLLPDGWKNGMAVNGDKKGKEREVIEDEGLFTPKQKDRGMAPAFGTTQQLRGFAALANGTGNVPQMGMGGRGSFGQQRGFGSPSPPVTKGASADDAIEL